MALFMNGNSIKPVEIDTVLDMYYRRDVLRENVADELPANIRDVEAILQADGMVMPMAGQLRITPKGRAQYCTGGYTAKEQKEIEKLRWQAVITTAAALIGAIAGVLGGLVVSCLGG